MKKYLITLYQVVHKDGNLTYMEITDWEDGQ